MNETAEKNPWTTVNTEVKFDTPWISVSKHDVLNPAGNPSLYGVVNFKNLAIGILPLDNDLNTWLVGQWRYPLGKYSWEIIEGGGPLGTDPLESAKRELKEETGIIASEFKELCRIHTSNSVTDEHGIIYLAKGLSFSEAEPEESEVLSVRKVPFESAWQMVMNGEITDSLSMVAILKAKILLDKNLL